MKNKGFYHKISSMRKKKKTVLLLLLVFCIYFFIYQFLLAFVLDKFQSRSLSNNLLGMIDTSNALVSLETLNNSGLVRGTRLSDAHKYTPDQDNMFTCFESKFKIPFSYVNDDYCDCPLDGSDEPGTNACDNGHFCCSTLVKHLTGRGDADCISSHKVNDGICDCCDGSDEWKGVVLIQSINQDMQNKLNAWVAPCHNRCPIKK